MANISMNTQKVMLSELNEEGSTAGRKASRIELRTLRDAYNLKPLTTPARVVQSEPEIEMRRLTAYCTAESYNLKNLYKLMKENSQTEKIQMYFGECLYISYTIEGKSADIYFMHYGVVVMWGLNDSEERDVLRLISRIQENPYDVKAVEIENFMYGISKNSQIVNDKIYISDESHVHTKMVLSIGIAQSVKLDYYEELVENTIDAVKDLPDEVEKEGKVGKKREDIMKVTGKLHKLSFNVNIVSNILGEPEFVWEYSDFSSPYETCIKYLDIKTRAHLLNKRCDIIHGILEMLTNNITTQNSERLENNMAMISFIIALTGVIQCLLLGWFLYYMMINKKSD